MFVYLSDIESTLREAWKNVGIQLSSLARYNVIYTECGADQNALSWSFLWYHLLSWRNWTSILVIPDQNVRIKISVSLS